MKQKEKIINYVLENFLREGSYEIKVDDIASKLNIRKEIVIKIFPTEEELLREVIETFMHTILGA